MGEHHSIVRYLAGLLRQCYFMVDIEATLSPTLRMDIVAEDKDSRLYIDVTVANSTSKTHEKKSFETLVKEKTAEKEKKYGKIPPHLLHGYVWQDGCQITLPREDAPHENGKRPHNMP
eukprot:GDKK01033338.1.p2 GENE.GDKK01033338.1~~GDKK01033338.1.p2  ORF type:complete len:118 (+),score=20.73 GDKK01033338.1:1-354(+)